MTDVSADGQPQLSKHRIEALIDGIFAVAMTLLVIELRLPEHGHLDSEAALRGALFGLLPNLISWLVSFFVLAIFWIANHRLYSYVRHADQGLLWMTILGLASAALLPFASAVNGQYASITGQALYSGVMIWLSVSTLLLARYIYRHPGLCAHAMSLGAYRATVARSCGVMLIAALAVAISYAAPGKANCVFVLMSLMRPMGTRIERHYAQAKAKADAAAQAQA
ncbi:TMEM175 family protein [Duganella sp. HH105]|uniref:TMEM175 family protein n=1 Tax=Duganella sp. HH105 TaxID=1781067 RepID=UPI000877B249|nr:TMEM175 family protein [Duganella sp. HH105]OEZ61309.1 hypothetical protein DUGA6_23350 [Duganella sp. HH105]